MKSLVSLRLVTWSLVALALVSGCASPPRPTSTPPAPPTVIAVTSTPQVIASVNGTPITLDAFDRELARWNAGRTSLGMTEVGPADKQRILDEMIDDELTRQLAAKQGIVVSDAQVDAQINQSIQQYGQQYFDGWLASNMYTMDEFRDYIRLELLTDQLKQPVIDSVPTSAPQVHARHILVNSQAEAQEVLTKLQAGGDFTALAAQYSVDVTTKDNGGDLGWFPRGGLLVPQVEDAAFSLQPGQISGIVASDWGYHIVQTLETGTRDIDPQTRQRLIEAALTGWRQGLRNGADIKQFISFSS